MLPENLLIAPLIRPAQAANFSPTRSFTLENAGEHIRLSLSQPGMAKRLHLYVLKGGKWQHVGTGGDWRVEGGNKLAFAAVPGVPHDPASLVNNAILTAQSGQNTAQYRLFVAPFLLASPLDPVLEVWVVRNPLTERFAAELAHLVGRCDGSPRIRFVEYVEHSSDIWMQDTLEVGVAAFPDDTGQIRQTSVALLGLRGKHDMGLTCGPLDAFVREAIEKECPAIVPVRVGEPRAGARWIDWYGNLEVSPPVKGYPFGRILSGRQHGLTLHPDALAFLEAQKLQWPPLFLNVDWLTIGHVDELINFVPAPGRMGFRALMPSPKRAKELLIEAVKKGHADKTVFTGRKGETTVAHLLEEVANTRESETIETALVETRRQLHAELGIEEADVIELPVLFKDGLAVIPNSVNGLVVGRDYFVPAPEGPIVDGEDIFQRAIRESLLPLGLRLHVMDVYEPYHVRSGEIHCGTNTIRYRTRTDWWNVMPVV